MTKKSSVHIKTFLTRLLIIFTQQNSEQRHGNPVAYTKDF